MQFSESHEWVKVTNSTATIGISQYAQKELGEIVHIELPKIGAELKAGEEMAVLESTKAAADIYTPISGEVIEVNENLQDHPELVNESPEEKGWLVRVLLKKPEELEKLMDADQYSRNIQS